MKKYLMVACLVVSFSANSLAFVQVSNMVVPVTYFVDHVAEIKLLKNHLKSHRKASIVGLSGMGKTQLARMYAYEHKAVYKLIWFFDCNLDQNEEFLKLAKIINKIENNSLIAEDLLLVKKQVIDYLSTQNNWLLIFDNLKVNDNSKVIEFIDWENNGHIIFCSQNIEKLPNVIKAKTVNKTDSIALVKKILNEDEQSFVEFLSEEFKGYPVLIVQGAQLINAIKGLDKKEYAIKIDQLEDKIKFNIELAKEELSESANKLLHNIALVNNQKFSKTLLRFLIRDISSIDDDIYQLQKLGLIANIDSSEHNPMFEMHDIIAEKILQINGDNKNREAVEELLDRLAETIPEDMINGHLLRSEPTIRENLEVIFANADKYKSKMRKIMHLNTVLFRDYINTFDYYNAKRKADWFKTREKAGDFKALLVDNENRAAYAEFLVLIGAYYKRSNADDITSLKYYEEAKKVIDGVSGYDLIKSNIYYNLALSYIATGNLAAAKDKIQIIERIYSEGAIEKKYVLYIHLAKARLHMAQGEFSLALDNVNNAINAFIENGVRENDLLLTNAYLIKSSVLTSLANYKESFIQIKKLQEMYKSKYSNHHEIFGRIAVQIARIKYGEKEFNSALEYSNKAISIFLNDKQRVAENSVYKIDGDLAEAYLIHGDTLVMLGKLADAIVVYREAQNIYLHLYSDKISNIEPISYLYIQGAKASCKKKDLYHYKSFGEAQIRDFGIKHINTIDMLKYCEQHKMDLWQEEKL
jgi:tetratricopeptide (TPR) repeat protein